MKNKKDLRLAFITINDTYAGIDIIDANHPYGYEGTESFRKCIKKYLRMLGFKSIQQYMRSLPGYSGKEQEHVSKPLGVFASEYIRFDYDQQKNQPLFFAFIYLDSDRLEMGALSFINTKIKVHVSKTKYNDDLTLTMTPTIRKVKSILKADKSKLWFCKDWNDNT